MTAIPPKTFPRSPVAAVYGLCLMGSVFGGLAAAAGGTSREVPHPERPEQTGAAPGTPARNESRPAQRPNILLIGIDTLRADHVGCLGYGKDTTPTLDRLAREGIVCTRTVSTSGWTLPSVMSVMTSLYPDVHRVQTYRDKLPAEITVLAEILKAAGYTTGGVTSNPTLDGSYGFARGFDLYDDFTVPLDFDMDVFDSHGEIIGDRHLTNTSELVAKVAAKWLAAGPAEPFFLFAFYFDPHYDYIPPPPFDTLFDPNYEGHLDGRGMKEEPRHSQRPPARDLQHLLALYDGEIRYTDEYVGKLLQALARAGVLRNTLVVLFGDHGDEFYEHGKTTHDRTLYQEILHVPLVFWWPDRLPAGRRLEAVTSLVDVMPTVLDYLGLEHEGPLQGASLRPLIEGSITRVHDTVWAELNTWIHVQAVMDDRCKLIRNVSEDTWELYQWRQDRAEQANLYAQTAAREVQLALTGQWERWTRDNRMLAEKLAPQREGERVPLDEQQLRRLKALGYVQ
jgi:arylsulfatase A-like enzyme